MAVKGTSHSYASSYACFIQYMVVSRVCNISIIFVCISTGFSVILVAMGAKLKRIFLQRQSTEMECLSTRTSH